MRIAHLILITIMVLSFGTALFIIVTLWLPYQIANSCVYDKDICIGGSNTTGELKTPNGTLVEYKGVFYCYDETKTTLQEALNPDTRIYNNSLNELAKKDFVLAEDFCKYTILKD